MYRGMCGCHGPRRWEVFASHFRFPTLSLHPRKEQHCRPHGDHRFWLQRRGGDKIWDLFSQVGAQRKGEGCPPAPGLQVQSPCHVGCRGPEEHAVSSRSGSCSLWARFFCVWARPEGCHRAWLPCPCPLLLRTVSVPSCLHARRPFPGGPLTLPSLSPPRAPGRPSVLRRSEASPCLLGILRSSGGHGKGHMCWRPLPTLQAKGIDTRGHRRG